MSRAAFEIVEPTDGRDPWVRLVGENGETLMSSETFQSGHQGALGNIEAVVRAVVGEVEDRVIFTQGCVEYESAYGLVIDMPLRRVAE